MWKYSDDEQCYDMAPACTHTQRLTEQQTCRQTSKFQSSLTSANRLTAVSSTKSREISSWSRETWRRISINRSWRLAGLFGFGRSINKCHVSGRAENLTTSSCPTVASSVGIPHDSFLVATIFTITNRIKSCIS